MKKLLILAAVLLLIVPAQADFRDGAWSEGRTGINWVYSNGSVQYQPMLVWGFGIDRVLIDAQLGFNLTTAIDSSLLQSVGVGARVFVWGGRVWKFERLHVMFLGTARSEAGETNIDFRTGEIGVGIRPDVKQGNKVMTEFDIVWLASRDWKDHIGVNFYFVFIIG